MRREIGGWLEGPQLRRDQAPGVRLGLPADGPGSVASFGSRLFAYVIDGVVANLLVGVPVLFGAHYSVNGRGAAIYLAFLLEELVLVTVSGKTLGMHVAKLRVIRVADGGRQGFGWIVARTLLLGLLIPALVWDRDQRGLHDRAAGTAVIDDRPAAPGARPAARSTASRGTPPARTPPRRRSR